MADNEKKIKTRVLRFVWGIVPWLMVLAVVGFVVSMGGRINHEKARLEKEKAAAMKKEIPPVRVITLTLKEKTVEDRIELPAVVEPWDELWVKAEVPGQVTHILADEGIRVKKGRLLMRLDDRDYIARLNRIEANYDLARLEYKRIEKLASQKITSASRLDEVEARLKDLVAQRKEAQLALERTRITSPISGRVNEIPAKLGDFLEKGQEVAHILQFDKVKVTAGVPESDVAAVLDLNQAEVIIDALDRKRVTGKKVFLSSQPRSLSRLYDLEFEVANPEDRILPGMFARVFLIKSVYEKALSVPLYAVITHDEEHFVFIEEEGAAKKRPVKLGVLFGWQVRIESGLKPGERVIVVGHRMVDDGQPVEVMKNVTDPKEIFES